jgi:hypothetical protein
MTASTFIQINKTRIQNIDGCLTDKANVTVKGENGGLVFYYFEGGKLTHSKAKVQGWYPWCRTAVYIWYVYSRIYPRAPLSIRGGMVKDAH